MSIFKIKNRKEVFAWSLYDFANQPFTTIIVTFIYSAFFVKVIAVNEQEGTFLWTSAIAITAVVVSLLSPILGALADKGGFRKFFLILSTLICAVFSILLYFPKEGEVYYALTCFVIANIAFEIGSIFCNSYLPDLSNSKNIGRISGYSWGLGFVGGLLALFIAFTFFDVNEVEDVKRINIFVALWFLIFSIPTLFFLEDRNKEKVTKKNILISFQSLSKTFNEVYKYKKIFNFLIARLFYNDGLVTIFALGGIYAIGTIGFSMKEVLVLGIVLNVFAAIGSFVFGHLEDKIGVSKVINISLVFLIVSTFLAFIAPWTLFPKEFFWLSGFLLGSMIGPTQSCSRSYMSQLIPIDKKNEFFGFFALTGKATSFLGPLLFGLISKYHTQQFAMLSVIVFFIIGLIVFNRKQD